MSPFIGNISTNLTYRPSLGIDLLGIKQGYAPQHHVAIFITLSYRTYMSKNLVLVELR